MSGILFVDNTLKVPGRQFGRSILGVVVPEVVSCFRFCDVRNRRMLSYFYSYGRGIGFLVQPLFAASHLQ